MKKQILTKVAFFLLVLLSAIRSGFAYEQSEIIGYWAMQPLNNGIANVANFDYQGNATLYSFECDFKKHTFTVGEKEQNQYKLNGDTIQLFDGEEPLFNLKIITLTDKKMSLQQSFNSSSSLTFEYVRVKELKPLCPVD